MEAQKLDFEKEAKLQHLEQTKLEMDEKEKKLFFFEYGKGEKGQNSGMDENFSTKNWLFVGYSN